MISSAARQRKRLWLKHLNYTYQEGEGGIADALSLVEHFAENQPICVVLGDNLIEKNIRAAADEYRDTGNGAKILLKRVHDPQRFGVPELDGDKSSGSKKNRPIRSPIMP